jgi:hypothetical protein
MRHGRILTDDVRKKIDGLIESMKSPTAGKIARKLGLKNGTVYWYMLTHGHITRKPSSYAHKPYVRNGQTIYPYAPEHDAMLLEMRVEDLSFQAIADALTERFGIPRNAHSVHNRAIMLAAIDDDSEAA